MTHTDKNVSQFLENEVRKLIDGIAPPNFDPAVKREQFKMYLPIELVRGPNTSDEELISKIVNEVGDDVLPANDEGEYQLPAGTQRVLFQFYGSTCPHCGGSNVLITFLGENEDLGHKVLHTISTHLG